MYDQCGGKTGPNANPLPSLGDFAWATQGGPACPASTACLRQVDLAVWFLCRYDLGMSPTAVTISLPQQIRSRRRP